MNAIDDYAQGVVLGSVPAGKYHRLACARHLRDREREATAAFPYLFDLSRAERFFRFAERLKHYKGEWAGQYIRLQPHQKFRLGSIFAWVHIATGLRRFRTAYNEIPRKNGKSLEAAIVALYVVFFDGEAGAEGYCIATKRAQSKIVFNDCKRLVQSSGLRSRITVLMANLHRDETASKLEPLGADHDSTDGLNPNLIINDEFHAQKDRGMLDVMETATGARQQPLNFQITTAGADPVTPCGDQHDYACKILDQVLVDETFFAFIAHADVDDDWTAEATWRKANPNYGVSVKPDDLRALATKATHMPSAAAAFKQKRLDLWHNDVSACLSIDGWRRGQSIWKADEQLHETCFVGIDLASKIDLCAMSFLFPPTVGRLTWRLLQYLWTPKDTLLERAHRDRAPLGTWVASGRLLTTPGTQINHQVIRAVLVENRERFDIERIGFDPWHADTLIDQLIHEDGFTAEQVVAVPQTYAGMSSACLKMQAEILGGVVDAGHCPVTAWSVSNCVDQRDNKDNMMFIKKKSRGRIDPVISATIAMALWLRQPVAVKSVYLSRGVRTLGE